MAKRKSERANGSVLRCECDHINIVRKGKLRRADIVGGAGGCTCAMGVLLSPKRKGKAFKVYSVAVTKKGKK